MKKTLLSLLLVPLFGIAQNQFSFGFDGTTAAMVSAGWQLTNQSTPIYSGAPVWAIASYTSPLGNPIFGSGNTTTVPVGQAGGNNSFAIVNYTSTGTSSSAGSGTISNWLISPNITVENGDVVTFYTRKGTDGNTDYADRLELRMSSDAATVIPAGGATNVGSFTTLGVSVNPNLLTGFVYPKTWTQYTYTVSGLTGPTAVKFAFRYFVTNGGPAGSNSDIIGIDTFSVDRPVASADSFFANNFSMYPNPVANELNIVAKTNNTINAISIVDMNGRTVKNSNDAGMNNTSVNVSDLNAGVYFVTIETNEGTGTSKFIKK